MTQPSCYLPVLCIFLLTMMIPCKAQAVDSPASEILISLSEDTEAIVQQYPSEGDTLLIWLSPVSGSSPVDRRIAAQLAAAGTEVWLASLLETYFLPATRSSLYKLPANSIAALIREATEKTGKAVFLKGEGAGIIPLLRGAYAWQSQVATADVPAHAGLRGVIVNSPDFYFGTPNPGEKPRLLPIVSRTRLPVLIIQPEMSPRYWQLPDTVPVLERAGSEVFVRLLRKVRGGFHRRRDAVGYEKNVAQKLASILSQSVKLLESVSFRRTKVMALNEPQPGVPANKKDRSLSPWNANPTPPPLRLDNLDGGVTDLRSLGGTVVMVNFWTTWCPPCVYEMPSLQQLQDSFPRNEFLVLGVNMAEDEATINRFLQSKVSVDFPIVLDREGKALKEWKVHAFPTTFVVDKNSRIRYALFGSIDWNTPEIITKIRDLTKESLN